MRPAWTILLPALFLCIGFAPAVAQSGGDRGIRPDDPNPPAFLATSFDLTTMTSPSPPDDGAAQEAVQGPVDAQGPLPPDADRERRYASLGSRIGAAKWETIGLFAYITATQAYWTDGTTHFHFKDEGWFGRNTNNLGIDKLTHAFNAYLFAEFLGARMARKTQDRARAAAPAGLLSIGLMLYGEMWDAHKKDSGFSVQDVIFNTGGATFSVLRHTVPGLEEKLDFRLLMMPNSQVYTFKGKRHYEQQRFLLSLELAGFQGLRDSPLRFIELQIGYRGKNFTNAERAAGIRPERDIFFGVGLNVKQLFFRDSRSRLGRAIGSGLNYFQLPYTAVHVH
ncbi:DUF2279 domain-containing protein [Sphingobium sp.]|uniref:DUF2279 domain-containing protein n=1 Tax=Sphingobium sp. TaxID=1912891 RepID=UPI0028BD33AE|nr:DUF2279 domain-containing protein [Sphingobium sp.]